MKAVEVQPDGSIALVDRPVPEIAADELLMKTSAAGICGSDLLDWYVRRKAGAVLGHEVAGEVVEAGAAVRDFSVGDRIVPHHHAPCLECDVCRRGRHVHCATWRSSALDPGGFAELVRVPAGNLARDTHRVPGGLSPEEASFTEPLATVVKAFRRGRFHHDDRLLVVGLGTTGQLAVRYGRLLGAQTVAAADPVASRRDIATLVSLADDVVDVSDEPIGAAARRLTSGRGYDFVFVGPGKSRVAAEALEAVAPGGTLVLFTMAAREDRLSVDAHDVYFREVSIVPSYSCGPVETRLALALIADGKVRVGDLISHRFPLDRVAEAFDRAREPQGSMKVMVTFGA